MGNAIREYKIPREKLVLLSKCYRYVGEEYVNAILNARQC